MKNVYKNASTVRYAKTLLKRIGGRVKTLNKSGHKMSSGELNRRKRAIEQLCIDLEITMDQMRLQSMLECVPPDKQARAFILGSAGRSAAILCPPVINSRIGFLVWTKARGALTDPMLRLDLGNDIASRPFWLAGCGQEPKFLVKDRDAFARDVDLISHHLGLSALIVKDKKEWLRLRAKVCGGAVCLVGAEHDDVGAYISSMHGIIRTQRILKFLHYASSVINPAWRLYDAKEIYRTKIDVLSKSA